MWTSALLIISSLICLIIYLYKFSKKRPENFPPGPPRLPFWGSYWFMLKENYTFSFLSLETLGKRYKTDILGLYLGNFPTVVTFSNELCKEILTRDEFIARADTITVRRGLDELKGIIFTDGPFWREHRRFSLRHLRDYGFGRRSDVMENFVADEIKYLINFLSSEPKSEDADICRGKGHVLMPDFLYGSLLNSILLSLASTRFDNNSKLRQCARKAVRFVSSGDTTGGAISYTPWLRFLAPRFFGYSSVMESTTYLTAFLKEIIDEHVKTFSDDHHRDFIDVFLSETYNNGYELDYNQLLFVVLDYMFPSPVVIGQTLSCYFAYLINNPDVQIKIQEEIDRVVGRSRLPTLDDRRLMPYLEASIREGIRILPTVPLGVTRRCIQDTTLAGYSIPKDTLLIPNVWTAHKDEKIWKDTEKFMPERFLDEEGNLLKKDYTLGFGAGKRLCAGETFARHKIFLITAALLQSFTLKSPSGRVELDIKPGLVLSTQKNWILTIPRD